MLYLLLWAVRQQNRPVKRTLQCAASYENVPSCQPCFYIWNNRSQLARSRLPCARLLIFHSLCFCASELSLLVTCDIAWICTSYSVLPLTPLIKYIKLSLASCAEYFCIWNKSLALRPHPSCMGTDFCPRWIMRYSKLNSYSLPTTLFIAGFVLPPHRRQHCYRVSRKR